MVFLDSSAIFALADQSDRYHKQAKEIFARALKRGEGFLLHNYILVESAALIQRRIGFTQAKTFLREAKQFYTLWIDSSMHTQVLEYFVTRGKRGISFVDYTSFVVMQQRGINRVFAFDPDFEKAGFELYS